MMHAARYRLEDAYSNDSAVHACYLLDYCRFLQQTRNLHFNSYPELHQWTVQNPESFWQTYLEFSGIVQKISDASSKEVKSSEIAAIHS